MRVIYPYLKFIPKISDGVFIAPTAVVIGRANLAADSNIWFNCVVRADVNSIDIGENTNIQDLSMLHVTEINALKIGANVSVGHSVVMHGCTIEDGCLIGMGSKILDGSIIGKNSLVAAGSVVPPNKTYPAGSFIMGIPAKVVRPLSSEEILQVSNHYKSYLVYKDQYLNDENFKV